MIGNYPWWVRLLTGLVAGYSAGYLYYTWKARR